MAAADWPAGGEEAARGIDHLQVRTAAPRHRRTDADWPLSSVLTDPFPLAQVLFGPVPDGFGFTPHIRNVDLTLCGINEGTSRRTCARHTGLMRGDVVKHDARTRTVEFYIRVEFRIIVTVQVVERHWSCTCK